MFRKHHPGNRGLWIVILTIAALSSSSHIAGASPTPITITLTNTTGGYQGCTETTLSCQYPTLNYGNSDEVFWVQKYGSGSRDYTALIRFDLTGQLPTGACIKSAKLKLYQWQTNNISSDYIDVAVYRCFQPWDEGIGGDGGQEYAGACWYYRKTSPSNVLWNMYGARGSNTDRHDTYDDVQRCTEGTRWVEWDVTPSVQWWVRNPAENYGLVLDWTEVGITTCGVNFRTSEWGNNRPVLEITYVIPTAEPVVTLDTTMNMNYFNADPNITATGYGTARMTLGGTTSTAGWGADGTLTTVTYNDSTECSIKTKLEAGIVGANHGIFAFRMWMSDTNYIQLAAVHAGYYELSGYCTAVGNGERHDGSGYWSSALDSPTYGVLPFSSTPENEATDYITWKLRYDKTNQMFYVYVGDTLVTYYSGVNFSNFKGSLAHANDVNGVATMVRVQLFDETTPPTPNPLTWATQPYGASISSIAMTSGTATDIQSPPVEYSFEELSGNPGGTNSGWQASTLYTDSGLSENTQYSYRAAARDSMVPPNVTGYTSTVSPYTLIAAPTGITAGPVTISTIDLTANGTLPNLSLGNSGVYFTSPGIGGINEWVNTKTDQATGLLPNTMYSFTARARNGSGIITANCPMLQAYSGMPTPTSVTAGGVTTNSAKLAATGSFPNLTSGHSGVYFDCPGAGGINEWIQSTKDDATGLTPNTEYTFKVKSRNGDEVETPFAATSATIRTLAEAPAAMGYDPIGCMAIQANWSANGNSPETEYFCREEMTGRESGWFVGTSWALMMLDQNKVYHFYVKARNAEGIETLETDLGEVRTNFTIGYVKKNFALNDTVKLSNKVVSGVLNNARMFFIQDARFLGSTEGPSGIAVIPDPHVLMPIQGQTVDVNGTLTLNPNAPFDRELVIAATTVMPRGIIEIPRPYTPINRDLGGEAYGLQEGVWNNVMADVPVQCVGVNTIGRLVTVFGKVNDGGLGGVGQFWIDDGSSILDNNFDCYGVRVDLSEVGGLLLPPLPDYCVVTGVLRCITVPGVGGAMRNVRLLVPRRPTDIIRYSAPPSD